MSAALALPPRTVTVLIVDDSLVSRDLVSTVLRYCGYETVVAGDAAEALRLIAVKRPDLVVSDVVMAGMGGYEMARVLKTNPDTHGVPVIFYTAKYHRSEVRRLPDDLATGTVIRKTGEMGAFIDAIAAALANAAA